jgi:4-amino-4-deoxy-L-arabinose transferase-like glycosyltransferase
MTDNPASEVAPKPFELRILLYVAITVALLSAAGIYGHVRLSLDPTHTTGMPLVLDHLYNLIIAGTILAIMFAIGNRVLDLFAFSWSSSAEELVFSTSVGAGILGLLIMGAGLAGLLYPYVVGAFFLAALVFCGARLRRLEELARTLASRDYTRPAEIAYILAFGLVLLVLLVRTLTPPHSYDEAIYHLAATKRFVDAHSLLPLYDLPQGNTHLLLHMLYVPCLMLGADSAAKLLSLGFALITAVALYAYARRFLNRQTGYLAALAFFGAGMVTQVSTTARIDVTLAGFLFLATYAMTVYLEERSPKWLWLSAALSGIAISIKLTGLLWVGILGCIYLAQTFYRASNSERFRHLRLGVLYFLVVIAVVSPWLLKNYVYFRDPFYPFAAGETASDARSQPITFFGPAQEEKLEIFFRGTKERQPQLAEAIRSRLESASTQRPERQPLRFWGYFTNPALYNVGEPFHTPNYLFVLCPLLILFARNRKLVWLLCSCVLFFVLMASSAWTARYLLPVYPPLTLIAAYVVAVAAEKLKNRTALVSVFPVIALLITTAPTIFIEITQMARTRELNYINGSMSRVAFLDQASYYQPIRFVNENLAPGAKVLMIEFQMGYDLQRSYIADTSWESTPWRRLLLKADGPKGIRDALKAEGITHVMYFPRLYIFAAMTGRLSVVAPDDKVSGRPYYYEQWRNWTTFQEFSAKYLEPVYNDPFEYTVYKVKE